MDDSHESRRTGSRFTSILMFLIHQFVSTIGIAMTAGVLTSFVFNFPRLWSHFYSPSRLHWVLTGTPYFPVQVVTATLLGWLVSRQLRHRSMLWVWVLPFGILCWAFVALPTITALSFQARLSHFFGWGCLPENHCADQASVTAPFYTALAYSLGAWSGRKQQNDDRLANQRLFWVNLTIGFLVLTATVLDLGISLMQAWRWTVLPLEGIPAAVGVCLIIFAFRIRGRNRKSVIETSAAR